MNACTLPGCDRPTISRRRMCEAHYYRVRRYGDPLLHKPIQTRQPRGDACIEQGCTSPVHARGLCVHHYNVAHYEANAERAKARARAWHYANPERAAEQRRTRDPQMLRDMARDYYWRNRETRQAIAKLYAMTPAGRAVQARWVRNNPEKLRLKRNRRRARMFAVPTRASAVQVEARMRYFGERCWMCGTEADCVDHVKPLSRGGPDIASNMRPACRSCNSRKSDRWEGVGSLANT